MDLKESVVAKYDVVAQQYFSGEPLESGGTS